MDGSNGMDLSHIIPSKLIPCCKQTCKACECTWSHTPLRLLFNTYFWFSNSNCQSTEWESFNIPKEFGELWRYSQSVLQFFGSACTGLNTLILPAALSFLALTNVQIWISLRSSFYQFKAPRLRNVLLLMKHSSFLETSSQDRFPMLLRRLQFPYIENHWISTYPIRWARTGSREGFVVTALSLQLTCGISIWTKM